MKLQAARGLPIAWCLLGTIQLAHTGAILQELGLEDDIRSYVQNLVHELQDEAAPEERDSEEAIDEDYQLYLQDMLLKLEKEPTPEDALWDDQQLYVPEALFEINKEAVEAALEEEPDESSKDETKESTPKEATPDKEPSKWSEEFNDWFRNKFNPEDPAYQSFSQVGEPLYYEEVQPQLMYRGPPEYREEYVYEYQEQPPEEKILEKPAKVQPEPEGVNRGSFGIGGSTFSSSPNCSLEGVYNGKIMCSSGLGIRACELQCPESADIHRTICDYETETWEPKITQCDIGCPDLTLACLALEDCDSGPYHFKLDPLKRSCPICECADLETESGDDGLKVNPEPTLPPFSEIIPEPRPGPIIDPIPETIPGPSEAIQEPKRESIGRLIPAPFIVPVTGINTLIEPTPKNIIDLLPEPTTEPTTEPIIEPIEEIIPGPSEPIPERKPGPQPEPQTTDGEEELKLTPQKFLRRKWHFPKGTGVTY